SPPAQMVLQLCGRVCRRLSFENPVSSETGFFFLQNTGVMREPDSYRGLSPFFGSNAKVGD
ncbi:hypothetical protein ACQKCJ_10070, partial [Flavobacterium sp. NPDC079362]|uniref:hypothetical protein n=1 Tax=Flavobacterium sp. NPDC079362 TaxID=3390566 RepID=UPI003CFD96AC